MLFITSNFPRLISTSAAQVSSQDVSIPRIFICANINRNKSTQQMLGAFICEIYSTGASPSGAAASSPPSS